MADPIEVTWTSVEDLKKDMGFLDPKTMCMRNTLPTKGLPAGWRLRMSKKELGEILRTTYLEWPGRLTLSFEAPPDIDEFAGLSPRSTNGLHLANAAYSGDMEKVEALISRQHGLEELRLRVKGYNSALNLAARQGHLDIMKFLLLSAADANSRNAFQETPLLCAANRARGYACKLLLEHKADVSAIDENGDNALDFLGPGDSERKTHCREVLLRAGCKRR